MPVCDILSKFVYCVRCLSALSPGEEVLQLLQNSKPFNLEEFERQESQLHQEDGELVDWLQKYNAGV